jgi:hypothetical protein
MYRQVYFVAAGRIGLPIGRGVRGLLTGIHASSGLVRPVLSWGTGFFRLRLAGLRADK